MFKVREDGQVSVITDGKCIFIERWNKSLTNPFRVTKLKNQMSNNIIMIDVDFDRNFIVSADLLGNLMIQRLFTNQILFPITQFFEGSENSIVCSSIMNDYLCVGSNNFKSIGTVDLKSFTKNNNLTFEYDNRISSLNICKIGDQASVIVSSGGKQFYNLIYLHLCVFPF